VLLLVVGVAGIALRATSDARPPHVGNGDLPLLGFDDQELVVPYYLPSAMYSVPDFAHQRSGIVTTLSVWVDGIDLQPGIPELTDTESITVGGQPATLGNTTVQGRPYTVIEWAPSPGASAFISVVGDLSPDPRAAAREAADRVAPMDRRAFETALTEPSPRGDYSLPPLIPAAGTDGVQLLELRSGSQLTIQLAGNDTGTTFVGIQVFAGGDRTDYGDRVLERPQVRGNDGEVIEASNDGDTYRLLRWNADGRTYQLRYPTSTSTSGAVELADGLRPPTADEWADLLFPPTGVWPGQDWFQWLVAPPAKPS
jgi:hypothetical protein